MYKFNNWLGTGNVVAHLKQEFESSLKNLSRDKLAEVQVLKKRYGSPFEISSKYDSYTHSKQVSGFSLFLMSFISILFIVTICVVLYFKIFSEHEEDHLMISKIITIGFTSNELKRYLYNKLRMVMIVPIIMGSLLGMCFCVAIQLNNVVEIEITNSTILYNALLIMVVYFVFILIYYHWLRGKYFKSLYSI